MKYIFLRELQSLVKDRRLFIFAGVILILAIFSGIVSSYDYQSLGEVNQTLEKLYDENLEWACNTSFNEAATADFLMLEKEDPALFLAGSQSSRYPNHSYLQIYSFLFGSPNLYYPQRPLDADIAPLPFLRYDMLFLAEVIFSFMVIMLTYNAISQEKEDQTLALVLSNRISRTAVLLGKIGAYGVIILGTLLSAMLVQLLTVLAVGIIPVGSSIIPKLGWFLAFSFLYLMFWTVLSMCLSAALHKSSLALTYLLIIWLTAIFIIPASGGMVLEKWGKPLPNSEELALGYTRIENGFIDEMRRNGAGLRGRNLKANAIDNHRDERIYAPIYLRYLDTLENHQYDIIMRQIGQLKFLYDYSSVSPSFLFRRIVESFLNRPPETLPNTGRIYRRTLMETLDKLDREDEESLHLMYIYRYMSQKPVKKELIPQYKDIRAGNEPGIGTDTLLWTALFLCEILLMYLLCQYVFNRADIRR